MKTAFHSFRLRWGVKKRIFYSQADHRQTLRPPPLQAHLTQRSSSSSSTTSSSSRSSFRFSLLSPPGGFSGVILRWWCQDGRRTSLEDFSHPPFTLLNSSRPTVILVMFSLSANVLHIRQNDRKCNIHVNSCIHHLISVTLQYWRKASERKGYFDYFVGMRWFSYQIKEIIKVHTVNTSGW